MVQIGSIVVNISVGSWIKRQCSHNYQCWFMVQAGSVEQANTVGFLLTGSDGYDNTAGLLLTGGDGPFIFYCFII